ncbi:hypothetical protein Nepgr_000975 [Nepenthes gracilis]|uniref:Uncharacterized protein n=1 Tax=Nepenthes gracilis TaxID=150966 RepID=A0AAD3RWZ7_NEPGR|nr:hypothetical protein Nepgr_000975 [Nepenthes gracilis]
MVELDPPAAAPEATVEEPAVAMDKTEELLESILEEAATCSAREDAPGPPPPGPGLEVRPERPTRRLWELASAVVKVVEQRDQLIVDREAEIAWLDARLATSGGEHREETAALEAVLAGVETKNAKLKAEIARLKEEEERGKARLKRLAERVATLENDLSLCICPHEVAGMMHALLLEGINVSRRIARLIDPDFPVELINLSNRATQHKDDLVGEPRDIQGPPPPL